MNTDADSVVYSLHPNCQGGDHYLSMCGKFYIIYKERGIYRRTIPTWTKTMTPWNTHSTPTARMVYTTGSWKIRLYTVKPLGDWGPQYHKTSNMNHDWNSHDQSFNNDVVNVLPGAPGQAVIKDGNSIGEYKLVKCSEKMENASKITGIDCTLFMNFSFFVLMVVYLSRNYE